eukprot:970283-Rhodomonas_salina.1
MRSAIPCTSSRCSTLADCRILRVVPRTRAGAVGADVLAAPATHARVSLAASPTASEAAPIATPTAAPTAPTADETEKEAPPALRLGTGMPREA